MDQFYLYVAGRTYQRNKQGDLPEDIKIESVSDYQMGELSRLKGWLYRQRTKIRLERDHAERRQTREEEAARRKAERPALFDF